MNKQTIIINGRKIEIDENDDVWFDGIRIDRLENKCNQGHILLIFYFTSCLILDLSIIISLIYVFIYIPIANPFLIYLLVILQIIGCLESLRDLRLRCYTEKNNGLK